MLDRFQKFVLGLALVASLSVGFLTDHVDAATAYYTPVASSTTVPCNTDQACKTILNIQVASVTYNGASGSGIYTWNGTCPGSPDGSTYIRPTGAVTGCFVITGFASLTSASVPVYKPVASIAALSALASPATVQYATVAGYNGQGTPGGGNFIYSSASLTVNGCTVVAASDGKYWVRQNIGPSIYDYQCDTLAHADSYATANSLTLNIGTAQSASGTLTLTSPTVNFVTGGSINCNSQTVTINNLVLAQPNQQIFVNCASLLSLPGTAVVYVPWWTGPYGNSGLDYSVGINAALTIVMRTSGLGPRILDATGFAATSGSNGGIYLQNPIAPPTNGSFGTILTQGQRFSQLTANTPIFRFTASSSGVGEAQELSVIGDKYTYYGCSAASASDTAGIVFQYTANSGNGFRQFTMQGGELHSCYGIVGPKSGDTGLDIPWASTLTDFYVANPYGIVVDYSPANGGVERAIVRQITVVGPVSPTLPVFRFQQVGGLELSQISIDTYGSTTPGTNRLFDFENDTAMDVSGIHVEQSFFNYTGGLFYVKSSTGTICHTQLATNTISASINVPLFQVEGISTASNMRICDIRSSSTTLGGGASAFVLKVPNSGDGNKVSVGRDVVLDASWQDFAATTEQAAEQIFQDGQYAIMTCYTAGITGTTSTTAMVCNAPSNTTGYNAYSNMTIVGVSYMLNTAITGSSATIGISIRSGGGGSVASCTLTTSAALNDECQWAGSQANLTLAQNAAMHVFYTSSSVTSTNNLSVQLLVK